MSLHSLIDLRRTFQMFLDIFVKKQSLIHVYCQQYLHVKLKHFWNYTSAFREHGNDGAPPKDIMMTQVEEKKGDAPKQFPPLIRAKVANFDPTLFQAEWSMNTFLYSYYRISESEDPKISVFYYLEHQLPRRKAEIFNEYINFMKTFRVDDLHHDMFSNIGTFASAYTASDLKLLLDWCRLTIKVYQTKPTGPAKYMDRFEIIYMYCCDVVQYYEKKLKKKINNAKIWIKK